MEQDFLLKDETYKVIGACMEVHKELGCGFLETVYQEALSIELSSQNIPFEKEKLIEIEYKGHKLEKYYMADFICFDNIIVELKALSSLTSDNEAQIFNYLKATGEKVGLLKNYGTKSLQYKRFVL